jgi:hypothetical protein
MGKRDMSRLVNNQVRLNDLLDLLESSQVKQVKRKFPSPLIQVKQVKFTYKRTRFTYLGRPLT